MFWYSPLAAWFWIDVDVLVLVLVLVCCLMYVRCKVKVLVLACIVSVSAWNTGYWLLLLPIKINLRFKLTLTTAYLSLLLWMMWPLDITKLRLVNDVTTRHYYVALLCALNRHRRSSLPSSPKAQTFSSVLSTNNYERGNIIISVKHVTKVYQATELSNDDQ